MRGAVKMKKYINIAIISFVAVCSALFYSFNADYLRSRIAYASIENKSDFSFNGTLYVTTSTEGFPDISVPYDFSGKVNNIAQRSMKYHIDSSSYVDGIQSDISTYFENGTTYTSTTVTFDGVDLGTEKVRSNTVGMKAFPQNNIHDYIDVDQLFQNDTKCIRFNKKTNMYTVELASDELCSAVNKIVCDIIDKNVTLTRFERNLKKEQYFELISQYRLSDISITYGYDKSGFIKLSIDSQIKVKESLDYPYERVLDIDLDVNVELASKEIAIDPPEDIDQYVFLDDIYGNN